MAIITEHEDPIDPPNPPPKSKPELESKPDSPPKNPTPKPNPNPFTFWVYFIIIVSLITFFFVLLSSSNPKDPKTRFLNLPPILRNHFSKGRQIKVQINPNQSPIEVFTYSQGAKNTENVLIVHGLGCSSFTFQRIVDDLGSKGVFATAIDLPGSGFSGAVAAVEREKMGGLFGRVLDIYDEIKEKGLFWGFDNLIEHGYVPSNENVKGRVSTRRVLEPLELGSQEIGKVLGQVVESLDLAPLHLVLHDSALLVSANWVVENARSIRSLTLIDTVPDLVAFPSWALQMPVVGDVVLGLDFVFRRVVGSCCSRLMEGSIVDAHRVLLKGTDERRAIVGMSKKMNYSFDLEEWASSDGIKGIPMQVLWSSGWSQEWSEEGNRVAKMMPKAKFFRHSGGRWPQDNDSREVAENIVQFVLSQPKTMRKTEEEPLPEHIQKMVDEAHNGDHHHNHDHHDGHGHARSQAGFMDAYGLGHGWGM